MKEVIDDGDACETFRYLISQKESVANNDKYQVLIIRNGVKTFSNLQNATILQQQVQNESLTNAEFLEKNLDEASKNIITVI